MSYVQGAALSCGLEEVCTPKRRCPMPMPMPVYAVSSTYTRAVKPKTVVDKIDMLNQLRPLPMAGAAEFGPVDSDPVGGPAAVGLPVPVGMLVGRSARLVVGDGAEAGLRLGGLHFPLMEAKSVSGKISISSVPQLVY